MLIPSRDILSLAKTEDFFLIIKWHGRRKEIYQENSYLLCPDNREQVNRSKIDCYYGNMKTSDSKKTLTSSLKEN